MHEALARTKRGLRSFAAYVPRDLVRAVLASGKEAVLEGETRDLTIFFSDIAGFTTLAESRTPEQLVEILGGYLDDVTTVIAAHDGTVDKFLGDGVMAFWGAPAEKADHAALACEAAVRIQRKLTAGGAAGKSLATRIGLASGPVLVGNLGSHERMNYTVMGDVANLASRLEGLNKQYGTSIMIAESTARAAGDRIIARPVDVVAVKGKTEATRVYEILALAGDDDAPAARALARASAEALDRYLARDFVGGAAACDHALAHRPDDGMLLRLRERCRTFVASPPSGDWTGVFYATDK
jgi:adenylate cyclase